MQTPSLRHMIGQMLLAGFPGTEMPDAQAMRLMEEYLVGNFILFARNIGPAGETARLCGALSEAVYERTGLAPFLAVDQEGGTVLRAHEGAFAFPGAMALSAAVHAAAGGETAAIRTVGRHAGAALRALGMNVDFAPVLDVNSEPKNPVIGVRAYGDTPETVAACGLAMASGLREGGVLPVFKHFPGHGNVSVDSHIGLPVNDAPRAALEQTEWPPFQSGIASLGMDAGIMTAHLVCRALEWEENVPGTLSPRVIGGLLPEVAQPYIEVSRGCFLAAQARNATLAAFLCGFGGICAGLQNRARLTLSGVDTRWFFPAKSLCGGLCAGIYRLTERLRLPAMPETFAPYRAACVCAAALAVLALLLGIGKFTGHRRGTAQDESETK